MSAAAALAECLEFARVVNRAMPVDEAADRMAAEAMARRTPAVFRKLKRPAP